ncbi:tetratricopeptide repeat protein [Nocardiopsis dassonvillei]|uniref:tetratricopeptide repeat protein n=1 Tax=Nocardiopsis dassonvillei TaxID=2014 RepID=UPI00200C9D44|nr:tetratricopeptide repeat protein [Nocardiopsis dassonvillei]MCK9868179.1 tetratricopeptide repeat protein [Nocardiopsis dassonvillei]
MSDDRRDDERSEGTRSTAGGVSGHGALLQGRDFSFTVLQGGERGGAGAAAPPRYAVPAPPLFVNRVRQLDRARAFIADGGAHARVLVVQASHRGGGASAFGLKALHDSYSEDPHRFPGGYFFADVERDGVMECVSEILRRAEVPEEEIPAAQDRRRQRLRGEFDRRGAVAVMVDGPGSVNDVLPFVATSPGSLTLVATAHDLDLGEALPHVHDELVELDALDEEHSAELLCAKARLTPGRAEERAAVAALVRLAGGRPELLLRYGRRLFRARRRMGVPEALEAVYREAVGEEALSGNPPGPGPRGPKEGWGWPRPVGAGNDAGPGRPSGGASSGRGAETGHGGPSGGGAVHRRTHNADAVSGTPSDEDSGDFGNRVGPVAGSYTHLTLPTIFRVCILLAADRFAEALEVAGTAGDPRAVRNALRKLGGVRLEQGREAEAEELLVRALELAAGDPVDDLQNRARLGAALGDLLLRRGRRDEALDRWARAAELHGRLGDHRRVGDMHLRRADALEAVDAAAARAALEEALAGYEAADDRRQAERVRARLEAGPGR